VSEPQVEGAGRQVFSRRTGLVMAAVGVLAFCAFLTLLAYAPDVQKDVFCRPNVYSKCAVGFAGLETVIRQDGDPVLVSRTQLARGRASGLMIVTPEPGRGADIGSLGFSGPILVILPKWAVAPDPDKLSWGRKAGLIPAPFMPKKDFLDVVNVGRAAGVGRPRLTGAAGTLLEGMTLTPGPIDQLQTLQVKGWVPVLTDDAGRVVMAQAPSSRIFVLADPDLMNTQGLANLDTFGAALTLVRSLRSGEGPVIFDLTLDGYRIDRSALKLMFDPPFLAVTLCLAAALALAGWQALYRFGPMHRQGRAYALGKEGLADNSAQLIRLARREAKMAPRYAALTRSAAAKAVGAPRDLTGEALTAFLDRLSRQRGVADSLAQLTGDAERVRDRTGLKALALRLYRWRVEMTRERH
jgi:hypothetical protein